MKEQAKVNDLGKYKNDRNYRLAFKLKVIDDLVANHESDAFIERKHGVAAGTVRFFRKTVLEELGYYRILEGMKKRVKSDAEDATAQEITELKKALELATMKVAALETLIEVAEDQFNISIRKKPGSKQSK